MFSSEKTGSLAPRRAVPGWLDHALVAALAFAYALRRRFRLYRMQALDDHRLDDIGITREELTWAIRLPLRVNAALALHDRAKQRRWAERMVRTPSTPKRL